MKLLRANKLMMEQYAPFLIVTDVALPNHLSTILKSGLIEKDGCVFIRALISKCSTINQNDFPDKTGYECFVNHIHIEEVEIEKTIKIAVKFFANLKNIIKNFGIDNSVRGIISVNETDLTVSFHLLHPNERWLAEDLDGYKEECIAEFELNNSID